MRRLLSAGFWSWIAAVVLTAALSAWVASRIALRSHAHSHAHAAGESPADLHAWMHRQLGLTARQEAILAPFENAFETERYRIGREISDAGRELAEAVREGDRASPKIAEGLERMNRAREELQAATLDHFFVMKDHLDPEQAARLLQWTHDSLLH